MEIWFKSIGDFIDGGADTRGGVVIAKAVVAQSRRSFFLCAKSRDDGQARLQWLYIL